MKICLKPGEHVRLAHDTPGASLRVYSHRGIVHVTALAPGDAGDVTVIVDQDQPSISLVDEQQLAAAEKAHGVAQ